MRLIRYSSIRRQESVDRVLLYYGETIVLNINEGVFWRSTLRNLHTAFKCHCKHMPELAVRIKRWLGCRW